MKLRLCSNSSTPIAPVSYHIRMLKTYIMQYLILTTAIFSVIYTGTHYCSILSSHQSCKDAVYTTPSFRKLHSQNQRMLKPAKLPTQATVDDRRKLILKQSRLYSSTIHQYAFHHQFLIILNLNYCCACLFITINIVFVSQHQA